MRKIVIAVVAVLVLGGAAVGGFVSYSNSQEQAQTSLSDTQGQRANAPTLSGSSDGIWKVADGSKGGYRVENEILRGATVTATGYTNKISGSITLADGGLTISAAEFDVDVASIKSENFERRDVAFQEALGAAQFPTATFQLTSPARLAAFPADAVETPVELTGNLTLKGVAKPVTFTATAVRGGTRLDVVALIPITFTDFGIENPSNAFATIGDTGNIDVSIGFVKT